MSRCAHPEMLVDTAWVSANLKNPKVRMIEVEVEVDAIAFEQGHVPGALAWSWTIDLCDTVQRDILAKLQFERLMAKSGIDNETTVIVYGDNNNWFAAWALWVMKIYGHEDVRLMDGGRRKWLEERREVGRDGLVVSPALYIAREPDFSIRAFLADVQKALDDKSTGLELKHKPSERQERCRLELGSR